MISDPIGDFIVRLKNAGAVGKTSVVVPFSKLKVAIALTLKKSGYLGEIGETGSDPKKLLTVELLYDESGTPKINGVKRISKPGRRLYAKAREVHPVKYGKGLLVLSTPQGIVTDREAREKRLGGETLFQIW
ncbi:30S ribosomal protein S8 [Candidatus Kaiserbacteria bacterium]|nr:30S ribosomal protein S8 [Candidatus Kaiserbacteria bacterium]